MQRNMYSILLSLLLIFKPVSLEELECKVENLTVTELSATSLTAAWSRYPASCNRTSVIYLGEGILDENHVELRVVRFRNCTTFTDLDPCRHYVIDVSAMSHNGLFNLRMDGILIASELVNIRLFIIRQKDGTYVFNSAIAETSLIAKDSRDNSECFPREKNANDSEPTGRTSTTPTMTRLTDTAETTDAGIGTTSTLAATTTVEITSEETDDAPCTIENLAQEVEHLDIIMTSETSINVSWHVPNCSLGLFLVSLSYDGRMATREVRLLTRNFTHFLGLEECHKYLVSVTPLNAESIWIFNEVLLTLATRMSWNHAWTVVTAMKSNDTVTNLKASKITTSSMEVSWTSPPPRECYDGITRFYVETEHNGSAVSGRSQFTKWNWLRLTGLEPCATYRVSVTVGLAGGYKSKEKTSIVVTTPADKVRNLTAVRVTPTSILVSWAAPAYWDCGAEKDAYFVKLESSPTPKIWHVDTNSILLSELEPCTSHEISVSIFFLGEVDTTLTSSIVVDTSSDSFSDCLAATLSVIASLPLCIILITVIVLVLVLRYRGLTFGRRRWRVTDNWRFARETMRASYCLPVENKTHHNLKTRTL